MRNVLYIINPACHGKAGTKTWEKFKTLWPDQIDPEDVIVTTKPGNAREIAASTNNYDILAAVGGDGTVGEIVSGIMECHVPRPKLAIVPCGTGNDIAQHIGIYSIDDAVVALRDGHLRSFDLVRVDCQIDDRQGHSHAFLYGSVGFSPAPMVKPWMKRVLSPKGAYYLGTLLQIAVYRTPYMTVHTEEQEYTGRNWLVIVGNSEWAGGGSMRICPGALTDDGELNITIIPSFSKVGIITKVFAKLATGGHINEPGISYFPGRRIQVHSDPPAAVALDGDLFGTTPATFSICPRALQIMSLKQPREKTV